VGHRVAVSGLEVARVGHDQSTEHVSQHLGDVGDRDGRLRVSQDLSSGKGRLGSHADVDTREGHQSELPDVTQGRSRQTLADTVPADHILWLEFFALSDILRVTLIFLIFVGELTLLFGQTSLRISLFSLRNCHDLHFTSGELEKEYASIIRTNCHWTA